MERTTRQRPIVPYVILAIVLPAAGTYQFCTTKIASETAQRERLNRELEIAREVQENLFPRQPPSISGLDYCGECRPAREVGGDCYDFMELPEGKFASAMGDISGKGIGASLLMANLQASLRGQISVLRNLPELMKRVNNMVYKASTSNPLRCLLLCRV